MLLLTILNLKLSKIIEDKLYLLHMNDEVKKTFTPSPMISFRNSRKSQILPTRIVSKR